MDLTKKEDAIQEVKEKKSIKTKGKKHPAKFNNKKDFGKDFNSDYRKDRRKNDAAWYTKYPDLANTAAKIAMHHRNGSDIALDYDSYSTVGNCDPIVAIPTLFCPGTGGTRTSGINLAADAMHKMLNRRYRGVYTRYQTADIGIIQLAILDFFSALAEADRAYGLALNYKLNQKQIPYNLLIAMHISPLAMVNGLADFRFALNQLALRARNLCLVRGYAAMEHWLFLMNNIFKDKDTERAQLFGFYRPGYWKWNPTDLSTGSALEYVHSSARDSVQMSSVTISSLRKPEDLIADLNDQLDALLADDDVDQVCSDILSFFGNGDSAADLVTVGMLPEEYSVDPIYSLEVCKQFHNLKTIGAGNYSVLCNNANVGTTINGFYSRVPTSYFNTVRRSIWIWQDADHIIHFDLGYYLNHSTTVQQSSGNVTEYGVTANSLHASNSLVIDDDILDPDPSEILEITRFTVGNQKSSFTVSGTTYYTGHATSSGSTIALGLEVYALLNNPSYTINVNGIYTYTIQSGDFGMCYTWEYSSGKPLVALSKYDWAPVFIGYVASTVMIYGDIDNYRTVEDVINEIHQVALLSEFKNPISDFIVKE